MIPLLTAAEMRAADAYAREKLGIDELRLMESAATAALGSLQKRFGLRLGETRGLIVAGPGNNGGDAYALARLLLEKHLKSLDVVVLLDPATPSCRHQFGRLKVQAIPWEKTAEKDYDWIVDGIFGVGLSRPIEGRVKEAVTRINEQRGKSFVLALDIPTGLDSDSGMPLPDAVIADETVTFGFHKRGLVTGLAANYVGIVSLAEIAIPRDIPVVKPSAFLVEKADVVLPERAKASHKGSFGHVFVVTGSSEKEGAAGLCALGALRAGAGLATLLGESSTLESLRSRLPLEIMTENLSDAALSKDTVFVVGPGLGTSDREWELVKKLLSSSNTLVLDADALTLLGAKKDEASALLQKRTGPVVVTPHPKEASRLLGSSVDAIQSDRFSSAKKIAKEFNAACVLKGKGSVLAFVSPLPLLVVDRGSALLAKGGSGDVLAGIIAGFLAQGLPMNQAVISAVYLHGRASEIAASEKGENFSTLASEITQYLGKAIAEVAP